MAYSAPPDGGDPVPAASKIPTFVMVLFPLAVRVPTTWWVSLVTVVVNCELVPVARASLAGVDRSVLEAPPAPAPVPQPI